MNQVSTSQRKLLAEFLANIAVAWFAGGVIGIFVSQLKNPFEILLSLAWGLAFSVMFLWLGFLLLKGVKA